MSCHSALSWASETFPQRMPPWMRWPMFTHTTIPDRKVIKPENLPRPGEMGYLWKPADLDSVHPQYGLVTVPREVCKPWEPERASTTNRVTPHCLSLSHKSFLGTF